MRRGHLPGAARRGGEYHLCCGVAGKEGRALVVEACQLIFQHQFPDKAGDGLAFDAVGLIAQPPGDD